MAAISIFRSSSEGRIPAQGMGPRTRNQAATHNLSVDFSRAQTRGARTHKCTHRQTPAHAITIVERMSVLVGPRRPEGVTVAIVVAHDEVLVRVRAPYRLERLIDRRAGCARCVSVCACAPARACARLRVELCVTSQRLGPPDQRRPRGPRRGRVRAPRCFRDSSRRRAAEAAASGPAPH